MDRHIQSERGKVVVVDDSVHVNLAGATSERRTREPWIWRGLRQGDKEPDYDRTGDTKPEARDSRVRRATAPTSDRSNARQ